MSDEHRLPGEQDAKAERSTMESPAPTGSERTIDRYRLLQKLGEGGMGEVWLAEQTEPVRRRVALKLIKPGMDTRQVVARFEAERQALAMMDHPAVASVFDAGSTPRGRPYFVMEYVQGLPITEHCDRHRLGTRERLELFCRVCDGVQHAHQKAIIHRDLKPSNVLVAERDGEPAPKIIDFGVAKAISHKLTERTMFTELGVLIGTPEYMSPEQAEMTAEGVDTRTDVYSLGVLLYELLVGALPFDPRALRGAGFDEIRRQIRENVPRKPSTRISTLGEASVETARRRGIDVTGLTRQLRGDLDWITLKTLEKDRGRRYASASELAADVRRHLDHRPVLASPPGVLYLTGKFLRRRRAALAIALAVALGSTGLGWGVARSFQHRALVRQARIDDLRDELRWLSQRDEHREAREVSSAILRLDPDDVRALRSRVISVAELGRRGDLPIEEAGEIALMDLSRIVELRPGASWPHRLRAWVHRLRGRSDEEAEEERQAAAKSTGTPSTEDLVSEALLAFRANDDDRAIELFTRIMVLDPGRAGIATWRGAVFVEKGDFENATVDLRVALALNPTDVYAQHNLGRLLVAVGKLDEAEAYLRRALERRPDGGHLHEALSHLQIKRGRRAFGRGDAGSAPEHFEAAVAHARAALAAMPDLLWARINLGTGLVEQARISGESGGGGIEEAIRLFEQAREMAIEAPHLGVSGANVRSPISSAVVNLCDAYVQSGRPRLALEACREATTLDPDDPLGYYNLAGVYALLKRPDDALEALEKDFALGDRDHEYLARDPWFAEMRELPRFADLLERMRSAGGGEP